MSPVGLGSFQSVEDDRGRIRVLPKADMPQHGAYVTIRTTDGRTLHREQLVLRGGIEDPFTWKDLVGKFTANASSIVKEAAIEQIVDLIAALDDLPSLRPVTEPLIGDPRRT